MLHIKIIVNVTPTQPAVVEHSVLYVYTYVYYILNIRKINRIGP
jgi:hypothetical protein